MCDQYHLNKPHKKQQATQKTTSLKNLGKPLQTHVGDLKQ